MERQFDDDCTCIKCNAHFDGKITIPNTTGKEIVVKCCGPKTRRWNVIVFVDVIDVDGVDGFVGVDFTVIVIGGVVVISDVGVGNVVSAVGIANSVGVFVLDMNLNLLLVSGDDVGVVDVAGDINVLVMWFKHKSRYLFVV